MIRLLRRSLLLFFISSCALPASQESVVIVRSPHERRALALLDQIWEPGCFKVYVIRSQSPDLPFASITSGRVFINEAFANSVGSKDGILRAVLAHEVAHAILKHEEKRLPAGEDFMEEAVRFFSETERRIGAGSIRFIAKAYPTFITRLRVFTDLVIAQEFEADEAALEILRKKGFDPKAYVSALQSIPSDLIEPLEREYDTIAQMIQETAAALREVVPDLSPVDALPPYPTFDDRITSLQRKLLSRKVFATVTTAAGCPKWLTDGELNALVDRHRKREEELDAKVKDLERASKKIDRQGQLKAP